MNNTSELKDRIQKHNIRIDYYRTLFFMTPFIGDKMYYLRLIEEHLLKVDELFAECYREIDEINRKRFNGREVEREFTREELKQYNGENGKDAYIAVNGVVYDVTYESQWGGGTHFGVVSGTDGTEEFNQCHGGEEILVKMKAIGKLID
ncbi:cytochrome b5 domain-containing protein [Oceanirhabdus sp. W0125-5]|uniref:cytochrome b5 domain-containing protein n=1 Tax=Oceanirhabdus sp. W0125-5 TaxID=2999116 RepID=UPI0022F318E8|nr:cytochrome b5 domain-containing protein [Oceanirhabdus sp. W0125-5]WBW99052.1 cytochrome b5 domain-containing protein [Oceanirhabdus sp. W0125-5]